MAIDTKFTREQSLVDQAVERIRALLESGEARLSDVLLSERELALTYKISRVTIRRALKRLVEDGYLASIPRRGYQIIPASKRPGEPTVSNGAIAFVQGGAAEPWEWSAFNLNMWNSFQRVAMEQGREMLALGIMGRTPEELSRSLAERGIAGAIVDSDDPDIAVKIRNRGIATVLVDNFDTRVTSVMQDNFWGAFHGTRKLIEQGHRRIAYAGQFSSMAHGRERLGGHLAALREAGLPTPEKWCLLANGVGAHGAALIDLARAPDGPTAALVPWHELLEDVGSALTATRQKLELSVWWGATPEKRTWWKEKFPSLPIPDGMRWETYDMALTAMRAIVDQLADAARPPSRLMIPVHHVSGKE